MWQSEVTDWFTCSDVFVTWDELALDENRGLKWQLSQNVFNTSSGRNRFNSSALGQVPNLKLYFYSTTVISPVGAELWNKLLIPADRFEHDVTVRQHRKKTNSKSKLKRDLYSHTRTLRDNHM